MVLRYMVTLQVCTYLKPQLENNEENMLPFPHGFISSGNSRPKFVFVGVNGVLVIL